MAIRKSELWASCDELCGGMDASQPYAPLVKANDQPSQSDFPDFNDQAKLGSGKDLVDRLTHLIAIFKAPSLNFSRNRANDDDIIGDACEFLMRHHQGNTLADPKLLESNGEGEQLKAADADLDRQACGRYDSLNDAEVRELVVYGKWLTSLEQAVAAEVERVSQPLTSRLEKLGERYGEALPQIGVRVEELEGRVAGQHTRMGFAWN